MQLKSQSELVNETHFVKNRNPLPILAMAKISASQIQRRKLDRLWWLAIAASLAVYLVTASLYMETWASEEKSEKNQKVASFFKGEDKNRSFLKKEEDEMVVEQAKGRQLAAQDIAVSSSSGSRSVSKDSVINLDHGDPTMFESFWRTMGEQGTIVIPGWQTMSYFSDVANICWFLEPEFGHEIRRLHKLVGNAVAEDRHIIVGTGSTQLFQAALYALSPSDAKKPMSVVSAIPYYSVISNPQW